MPVLNPNGFTLLNDTTVSSPMDVNKFIGEINPTLSYFAGDLATLNIFPTGTTYTNELPNGYIYPCPLYYVQTVGATAPLLLTYSRLGVFLYFEYTPLNSKIPIQSRSFIAGTPVAQNTKILAAVSFSPTATFSAQIKTDVVAPTGVPRSWLYTNLTVGCDNQLQFVTLAGAEETYELYFPVGNSDPVSGGSTSYLWSTPESPAPSDQEAYSTPYQFINIKFIKMTDIAGSGFSTSTNVIPNPIVECFLPNNSLINTLGSDVLPS